MAAIDEGMFDELCEKAGAAKGTGDRDFIEGIRRLGILTAQNFAQVLQLHQRGSQADFDLADSTAVRGAKQGTDRSGLTVSATTPAGRASERQRTSVLVKHVARLAAASFEVRRFREWLLGGPIETVDPKRAQQLLELPTLRFLTREQLDSLNAPLLQHGATLVRERLVTLSELRAARKPLHEVLMAVDLLITWPGRARHWRGHFPVEGQRLLRVLDERGQEGQAVLTYPGSVLDVLRVRAESIAGRYGWPEAGATRFLLTGIPPTVPTISGGTRIASHGIQEGNVHLPVQATITINAQAHVSPRGVAEMFARLQRRLTGHRKGRDVSASNLVLVDFVCEQIVRRGHLPPWRQLLRLWNGKRRTPRYTSPSKMQRDYESTAARVFLLDVR